MNPAKNISHGIGKLNAPVDAASLAFFRIVFGGIMFFSQLRFLLKGWVEELYIKPSFFFKYYGFAWIQPLPGKLMYLPWIAMLVCLVFVILGKYYRVAIASFFILFSYTELLDLTNYLNHYYLVSLLSFLMIFLPMNACFSLDARRGNANVTVPRWTVVVLCLQVGIVYFFAGLSKIKYDWLIDAQPMGIWLGTFRNIPLAGKLLAMPLTAYVFSWIGMLFDLTAPFLLLNKKTRPYEYAVVVLFHAITLWLFHIGIFPLVMMGLALIFFSAELHRSVLTKYFFWLNSPNTGENRSAALGQPLTRKIPLLIFFGVFFLVQCLLPLRHWLYRGDVLWTEQGFRYSWNVMLMEKNGIVEFYAEDKTTGERFIEYPKKYLTPLQEKMMSTQPDMILQFAHFLADQYREKLGHPVAVYADAYVALNRRPGQTYIDPRADLSVEQDSFAAKNWILKETSP